jgi:uncharacterized membrane protein
MQPSAHELGADASPVAPAGREPENPPDALVRLHAPDEPVALPRRPWGWKKRTLVALSLCMIILFILATPAGLLNKADMIGYAICHRIPSHSLLVGERPLPLCARCTGTYLGAMLALGTFLITRRGATELPPFPVLLTLVGFSALMAIDGLNSYINLFPGRQGLYQPHNTLRLLTGTLNGLMMGSILYPVAVGTFWRLTDRPPVRALRSFRELGGLVLLALGAVGLASTGLPIVLYPVALISSAGIVVVLTVVITIIVLVLGRRENTAESWRDLIPALLIGLAVSLALIGTADAVRYALTGTLSGLPGLPP